MKKQNGCLNMAATISNAPHTTLHFDCIFSYWEVYFPLLLTFRLQRCLQQNKWKTRILLRILHS
ncbi:hypothetical protein OIU76_009126 [Salix suchowensis]|nr:hypothetical protein OIU76_009126 [Salix suchowensis]